MTDRYERIREALEGLRERCAQEAECITARRRAVAAMANNEAVKPCGVAAAIREIDVQQYYECAVREIERLRAEVERLNRILGRIVDGDGDSTLTIRAGTDAFAAAKEFLSVHHNRKRIAWQLERTAMGDGYYGEALRAAKELPEATPSVQALLDRWATGEQNGLSDRTDLCTFALQIYMSELEQEDNDD